MTLSDSHSLDLRSVGDIVLNPALRKSEHYLRHRTHMQVVPFDVYFHYIYQNELNDRQTDIQINKETK